jgi:hypothetical protein
MDDNRLVKIAKKMENQIPLGLLDGPKTLMQTLNINIIRKRAYCIRYKTWFYKKKKKKRRIKKLNISFCKFKEGETK